MSGPVPSLFLAAARTLGIALGVAWAFFAWSKLAGLVLAGGGSAAPPTWADRFPGVLHAGLAGVELLVAVWWFAGLVPRAAGWSLALLGVSAGAMLVWPWTPGTACGCAGNAGMAPWLDQLHPHARNAALAGGTLLAWALAGPSSARLGTASS